jgi:hypothetical protein
VRLLACAVPSQKGQKCFEGYNGTEDGKEIFLRNAVSFFIVLHYLGNRSRYQLDRRLGETHIPSGRRKKEKILCPGGT